MYDIKYHKVLKRDLALQVRDLIQKIYERNDVRIIRGHVSPDHVHLFVSAPPKMSVSQLMQYIKGNSSRQLQEEYPSLSKRYGGRHLWGRGYFCATSGTVTDERIEAYLEKHSEAPDDTFTVPNVAQ